MIDSSALYGISGIDMALCVLSQTALWQRKEYRIDRMLAYISSPEFSYSAFAVWGVAIVLSVASFVFPELAVVSMIIVLLGYCIRGFRRGIFRPKRTTRSTLITGISFFILFIKLVFIHSISTLSFLVIASPIVVVFAIALTAIPTGIQKRKTIQQAIAHRNTLPNVHVIGITGSVGKTSTKTYALHILQNDSKEVIATKHHRNSPYVVAMDLLTRVTAHTATYIAELAAYRPGEIKELCAIVQPNIGVITAITNQHLAMFGSLDRLATAKWELADSLPTNGTLVLNKDDETIRKQAKNSTHQIVWYSMRDSADVVFEKINIQVDHIECELIINNERQRVRISVVSRGQLYSVLAAVAIGFVSEMPIQKIIEKLASLPQLEKTMEYKKRSDGLIAIDDSYSASEASVLNAIEYLKAVGNKDSLLVMVPIIELGSDGHVVHERIGKALVSAPFRVMIYGNGYKKDMLRGFAEESHKHIAWYEDPKKMLQDIQKDRSRYALTVLEGRLPETIRTALL